MNTRCANDDAALGAAVQRLYADIEPSAETLQSLALTGRRRGKYIALAIGTVPSVVAASLLIFLLKPQSGLALQVAEEVHAQHQRHETLTFKSTSFESLAAQMQRLDFPLLTPGRLAAASIDGAKYCSVAGRLAAGIALRTADGQRSTLYVLRANAKFRDLSDQTIRVHDGRVELWNESGLFYALVTGNGKAGSR